MADLPTIESLFAEIKRKGCRLNNLFHLKSGMWQANLRRDPEGACFAFGFGPDPQGALTAALEKAAAAKPLSVDSKHPYQPLATPLPADDGDLIG